MTAINMCFDLVSSFSLLNRCMCFNLAFSFSLLNRCIPNYLDPDATDEVLDTAGRVMTAINMCFNLAFSFSLLNRCIPNYLDPDATDEVLDTAGRVMTAINADDFARKVLSDLYESWKEMLALCFISLGN